VQSNVEIGIAERLDEERIGGFLGQLPQAQRGGAPLGDVAAIERPRDLGRGARPHEGRGRQRNEADHPTDKSGTPARAHRR